MKTLERIKRISIELLENKEALTVENIVIKSLFSVGGTLAGYEKEIQEYLNLLIVKNKINAYKSYNKQTKKRILVQFDGMEGLKDSQMTTVLKRLPNALKAAYRIQVKYNKIFKTVKCLETHQFAPELNKLHFKSGETKRVAGKTTIESAINSLI